MFVFTLLYGLWMGPEGGGGHGAEVFGRLPARAGALRKEMLASSRMRLPGIEECENEFQRQYGYGDDIRQYFHPRPRKPGPFSYHLRMHQVQRAFREFLSPPAAIADVACAAGNFALQLAESGYKVTGVDLLDDFLRYAKRKRTVGEIEFVQGNLMTYRHPCPLDGILMGEVIEHVAWPEHLIASANEKIGRAHV